MAVHCYPLDHNDFWPGEIGEHALLAEAGAFGRNLALRGLTESEVLIGDQFDMGTSPLEVSQLRQPCWKVGHRFGVKGMVTKNHRQRAASKLG